jgi:hypothetical protein
MSVGSVADNLGPFKNAFSIRSRTSRSTRSRTRSIGKLKIDRSSHGCSVYVRHNGWRCAALPGQATDAAQAPLRRPPTSLPCPDEGNVSTSALILDKASSPRHAPIRGTLSL